MELSVAIPAIRLTWRWGSKLGRMNRHVLEISTHVFRLLRRLAPLYISWSKEKAGPTQHIVVDDDVYSEIINRTISKRKTVDEICLELASGSLPYSSRHRPAAVSRRCPAIVPARSTAPNNTHPFPD